MDQPPTPRTPLLDPSLYTLDTESLAFFKSTTGIYDDDELKEHILNVQAQAYAVCSRQLISIVLVFILCVLLRWLLTRAYAPSTSQGIFVVILDQRSMSHVVARLKISKMPAYKDVLKLGQERRGALLLDIGCCCTSLPHLHV